MPVTKITNWLNNQEWYLEGKSKWEGLDPQARMITQIVGVSVGVLSAALFAGMTSYEVSSLKAEMQEREALMATIQTAQDEIRRLKSTAGVQLVPAEGSWKPYIDGLAGKAGVDTATYKVLTEKALKPNESSIESLVTLEFNKINLRQLIQLAIEIENGSRPVKITQLNVDTGEDLSGWLNAKLSFSGYSAPKGP